MIEKLKSVDREFVLYLCIAAVAGFIFNDAVRGCSVQQVNFDGPQNQHLSGRVVALEEAIAELQDLDDEVDSLRKIVNDRDFLEGVGLRFDYYDQLLNEACNQREMMKLELKLIDASEIDSCSIPENPFIGR